MVKNINKILLLVIATWLLMFNSSFVLAQQPGIEITRVETQIMPEYDTPEILIVNNIEMKNSATLDYNGDVKWRVPKGAFKQIVSDKNAGDTHIQFNVVPSQDYDELVWKFPAFKAGETKSLHLEFYYNNLQGNPDKKFTFEFSQPYPVNSAEIIMLQPIKATNFKITPEFGQPIQGQNGFSYSAKNFTNIAADQKTIITASYTKTDPNPSVNPQQQQAQNQAAGQGGGEAAGNTSSSKVVILFLAGFAIVIVLIVTKAMLNKNRVEDSDDYDEDEDFDEDDDELDPWEKSAKKKQQANKNKTRENKHSRKVSKHEKEIEIDETNSSTLSNVKWFETQKRKLRQQLIEGRISESMYIEMLMEVEEEAKTRNKD